MTGLPDRLTLIFDGSCDFCTRSVRRLRALDRHGRLTMVPFQDQAAREAAGLSVAQCEAAVWAITPDGSRYHSAEAANLAAAVALGTDLPLLVYGLPGLQQLQEGVYSLIARNRHLLPGDRPYCEQYPERCRGA